MSSYKKEIQDFLPADELHENDAVVIDQPSVPNTVTEVLGVTRKATVAQIADYVAVSGENADAIDARIAIAVAPINQDLGNEAVARQIADEALQAEIDLGNGRGGALTAHDFGTAAPTQAALIEYSCRDIWGDGGTFTFNAGDPRESTYVIGTTPEVTHKAGEIFNNTWVRNTYQDQNHKWVLTNTPDTAPTVYIWTDVGQDVVAGATDTYAGVAKLYNSYTGGNTDGSVTQAQISAMNTELIDDIQLKLMLSGGAMTGLLRAMPYPTQDSQVRNIAASMTALTPASSLLPTGELYVCYE
jgi:hypothetical protein